MSQVYPTQPGTTFEASISAIIPCHNVATHLDACLTSVRAQLEIGEILLIDDIQHKRLSRFHLVPITAAAWFPRITDCCRAIYWHPRGIRTRLLGARIRTVTEAR